MASILDNKTCCTVPPVKQDYTPSGTYTTLASIRTYTTGPSDAKTAIVYVYDIFGFTPQALQGADILASQGVRVVMPEFLGGDQIDTSLFQDSTPEKQAKIKAWFEDGRSPQVMAPKLAEVVQELKNGGVGKVGAVGFCWGAKCITLCESGLIDGIAMVHPSFTEKTDGEKLQVPVCLLPSKDEDAEVMKVIQSTLEKKPFASENVYKTFTESAHGWAAARGDFSTEKGRKDFDEAFSIVHAFFKKVLG